MVKSDESKLQFERDRSLAAVKYYFKFINNYHKAIFPIYKFSDNGQIELIGTGFFVAKNGIFVTADHVFKGFDIEKTDEFEIHQESEGDIYTRPIEKLIPHKKFDLCIGKLGDSHKSCKECNDHPIVSIMRTQPIKHEVLGSFSFSHTVVSEAEVVNFPDGPDFAQHVKYRSHWEIGTAEEYYPDGYMFVKGPCFTSSIFVEGRGSGGPVFNSNGFVIGVNSRGFAPVKGLPHSTASDINGIMDMLIEDKTINEHRDKSVKTWPNKPIVELYNRKLNNSKKSEV